MTIHTGLFYKKMKKARQLFLFFILFHYLCIKYEII